MRLRNFIGGEWVESDASSTYEVLNPATGEKLAETQSQIGSFFAAELQGDAAEERRGPGGMTGDTLGASNEISEIVFLIILYLAL